MPARSTPPVSTASAISSSIRARPSCGRQGRKVRLREQPAQILMLLLARPGDLVTREEARQALWPGDTFVDFDVGLNSAIKRLRDALDDSAEEPRFVETLPRRGYRFIAPVEAPATPRPPSARGGSDAGGAGRRRSRESPTATPLPRVALPAALAVVLSILALATTARRGPVTQAGPTQISSIAVLPFENLTGDREQDYFADGMTDALISSLAQVRALRVISRTSVTQYRPTDKLLPRIAADLNVDAVVEGTVARSGNRVRVTAQLIHAPDRPPSVGPDLRARAARRPRLAGGAGGSDRAGGPGQGQAGRAAPDGPDGHRRPRRVRCLPEGALLSGQRRRRKDLARATEYFQQASAIDPAYAPAYSGLSDTYRLSGTQRLRPHEYMPKRGDGGAQGAGAGRDAGRSSCVAGRRPLPLPLGLGGGGEGVPAQPGAGSQLRGGPSRLRRLSIDGAPAR